MTPDESRQLYNTEKAAASERRAARLAQLVPIPSRNDPRAQVIDAPGGPVVVGRVHAGNQFRKARHCRLPRVPSDPADKLVETLEPFHGTGR